MVQTTFLFEEISLDTEHITFAIKGFSPYGFLKRKIFRWVQLLF